MHLPGRSFCMSSNWETNKDNDLYLQFVAQVRAYGKNTLVTRYWQRLSAVQREENVCADTTNVYTLTYKRCDYIHTQTYVCIYKYLCVDICTYICMVILNIGVTSLSYANLGLFQRRVSEIWHFYFSILTSTSHWIFFCLMIVATRNVDRTTKLPSLLLINILHDRQKLTKEPSWRENKNHWQMRASCQMLCLLTLFPLMHEKHTSHWSDKNENYFMNRRKKLKGISDIFDREMERYNTGILSQWRRKCWTLQQRINKVVVTDSNAQTEEMWLDFSGYWKSSYSVNGRKSESEKLNAAVCSDYHWKSGTGRSC